MIGTKTGKWKLCDSCDTYCELEEDGSCSECGVKE